MSCRVVLTKTFSRHLRDIGDYIARDQSSHALSWLKILESKVMLLCDFPEAHPYARENTNHKIELRQLIYGRGRNKYRIIFTVRNKEVVVLDIRHAAREPHPSETLE